MSHDLGRKWEHPLIGGKAAWRPAFALLKDIAGQFLPEHSKRKSPGSPCRTPDLLMENKIECRLGWTEFRLGLPRDPGSGVLRSFLCPKKEIA